jgi:hypothetical protein
MLHAQRLPNTACTVIVFWIEVMPIWFQDIRHLSDVAAPQSHHESGQHERTVVERQIRAIGRTVFGESALQARRCPQLAPRHPGPEV